jgi:hypothetical protein
VPRDIPTSAFDGRATVSRVAWPWREAAGDRSGDRRRRAGAARRGAAVRAVVGLAVAAALAFWKPWLAVVVAAVSLLVLALALASPLGAYARFEHALGRFAHGVGTVVTWLLMPPLYYLLFLPVGLLLRGGGKLRLTRGADPEAATYWTAPPGTGRGARWQGDGAARYRRQF